MKTKKIMIRFGFLLLLSVVTLTYFSCDKELIDTDTSVAVDNAIVEAIFADEQNIADQSSTGDLVTYIPDFNESILSQCATITRDLTSTPKTITVDFGTNNCMCADGRERRGKIMITFTGAYKDSSSVITHGFDGYFVNDHEVKGTKTVTNEGKNSNGNFSFTIDVDAVVIKPAKDSVIWKSTRTNEWVEGDSTVNWTDDVYLITGDGSGVTSKGVAYVIEITKALRKEIGYKHLTEGTIEITPSGKNTRTIDYGDGTRDNKATVTILNRSFNILLD